MRKIEEKMNDAILSKKDVQLRNTEVKTVGDVSTVYLFGHKIAEICETSLTLWDGGSRTKTTKSRLNAILDKHGNGEKIIQKAGIWYIMISDDLMPFVNGIPLS